MNLPSVLAGPIVRRAEPEGVCLWLATNDRYQLEARLYSVTEGARDEAYAYEELPIRANVQTVKLGNRLYVHLVLIRPDREQRFCTKSVYAYDIHLMEGDIRRNLEALGLLPPGNEVHSLAYPGFKYPTFVLPDPDRPSHILYGSCRKLQGKGEDSLAAADVLIEKQALAMKPERRPSALFLLGDQIYADDVASPMMAAVQRLAAALHAAEAEEALLRVLEPRLSSPDMERGLRERNARKPLMTELAGLTAGPSENHLLTFHEYAAMYLLAWNPEVWPEPEELQRIGASTSRKDKADMKRLLETHSSLYRVRRLLAHVPVYMMFDDHDVTDDWNITSEWKSKVARLPLGRHLVANALSAYWAFQGWGNDPDAFPKEWIKIVERQHSAASETHDPLGYSQYVHTIEAFGHWWYTAPTEPRAIVLDTRTQREYDQAEGVRGPRLVSPEALQRISDALPFDPGGKPMLVISAAPVYGVGVMEVTVQKLLYPLLQKLLPGSAAYRFDYEAWKYNGEGFTGLLRWAAYQLRPRVCVFLSGDVHTSSAVQADVSFADGTQLRVLQYTSSAIKNRSMLGLIGALCRMELFLKELKRLLGKRRYYDGHGNIRYGANPSEEYVWQDEVQYLRKARSTALVDTKDQIGLASFAGRSVMNKLLRYRNHDVEEVVYQEAVWDEGNRSLEPNH